MSLQDKGGYVRPPVNIVNLKKYFAPETRVNIDVEK
jgi:hypothetical protein